jgi:hypothetical protein
LETSTPVSAPLERVATISQVFLDRRGTLIACCNCYKHLAFSMPTNKPLADLLRDCKAFSDAPSYCSSSLTSFGRALPS